MMKSYMKIIDMKKIALKPICIRTAESYIDSKFKNIY